jgi:hypothetical protein
MDEEKFFTMRIPVEMHTQIKKTCADNQISMKQFAVEALCSHLANQEFIIKKLIKDMNSEESISKMDYLERFLKNKGKKS